MKRILISLFAVFLMTLNASAIPAYPKPVKLTMPDGKTVTIIGHGDEFKNYLTTSDGFTVVTCEDNFIRYAKMENNKLVATDIIAHDPDQRSASELKFLASQKQILPVTSSSIMRLAPGEGTKVPGVDYSNDTPFIRKAAAARKNYRGIVILVNYKDCQFRLGNERANELYTQMINQRGFNGYTDDFDGKFKSCQGSLRDYFYDNSYGEFDPEFDVYGPVDIDYSMYDMQGTTNSQKLAKAVLTAVDPDIDFKNYDSDGNGEVDMFYIIYAGHASSYSGNDSRLLWPHASYLYSGVTGYKKDGIKLGRYACSTELYGLSMMNDKELNGIGTMCHEFSHVLGYADHYDTSYGGQETPGDWDVMAGGNYLGTCGRCPAGYNAYERITGGFLAPTLITLDNVGETLSLNQLNDNRECYRLDTQTPKEFFLLENRQNTRWDSQIPGHGMLVWKVDSTDMSLWYQNQPNSTSHSCMKLIRANGKASSESQNDPFPGSKGVTILSNNSPGNLISYNGSESPIIFKKIKEQDKVISFTVVDPNAPKDTPEGAIFYESFNDCEGTGGNDNDFNTGTATAYFCPDYDEWTTYKSFGGDQCARFGNTSSPKGYAITPAIALEEGKAYEMTFRAAPYYTQPQDLKVEVYEGNATLEVEGQASSTYVNLVTKTKEWTDFSVKIAGSGDVKLKFSGKSNKTYSFFLDEVLVKEGEVTGIREISTSQSFNGKYYNLNGQEVNDNAKGILIFNGKKMLMK